jgi:Putative abortive phage resistance protein AbiGi, antitoxin
MPISSNCIIHFTPSKNSLLGILSDDFRINYCTEQYQIGEFDISAKVPMVSFCDIPLSQIKEHIEKYGSYGIGLTKEWAARNRLNPVLYIEKNSHVSESIGQALDKFIVSRRNREKANHHKAIEDIFRHIKNYQGELIRKGENMGQYRFSDEREWRFVPHYSTECEMIISVENYGQRKNEIEKSIEELRLKFEPNDIKYIIIQDDAEITDFVDHLRRAKGKSYTYQDVERLTTRILTKEQIFGDM